MCIRDRLKEAAEFFLAYLVEDPATGWLLSGPSNSPENQFLFQGEPYAVCLAPTADRILIHELFAECIEASKILGVDQGLRERIEAAQAKLPPYKIGRHGQIPVSYTHLDVYKRQDEKWVLALEIIHCAKLSS